MVRVNLTADIFAIKESNEGHNVTTFVTAKSFNIEWKIEFTEINFKISSNCKQFCNVLGI